MKNINLIRKYLEKQDKTKFCICKAFKVDGPDKEIAAQMTAILRRECNCEQLLKDFMESEDNPINIKADFREKD